MAGESAKGGRIAETFQIRGEISELFTENSFWHSSSKEIKYDCVMKVSRLMNCSLASDGCTHS
jgi:hypothetical protein